MFSNHRQFSFVFEIPSGTRKSFEMEVLEMRKKMRRYVVYSSGFCWILTTLQPARKKTKVEVVTEVIAKSKERKVRMSLQSERR
jgi:hypothetical protein